MILRDSFWKDWSSTLYTPGQSNLYIDETPIRPYSILLVTNVTAAIAGTSTAFMTRSKEFFSSDLVPGVGDG